MHITHVMHLRCTEQLLEQQTLQQMPCMLLLHICVLHPSANRHVLTAQLATSCIHSKQAVQGLALQTVVLCMLCRMCCHSPARAVQVTDVVAVLAQMRIMHWVYTVPALTCNATLCCACFAGVLSFTCQDCISNMMPLPYCLIAHRALLAGCVNLWVLNCYAVHALQDVLSFTAQDIPNIMTVSPYLLNQTSGFQMWLSAARFTDPG